MSWQAGLNALNVKRFCTRIEIKPHNVREIKAGVKQLLDAKRASQYPNRACRGAPLSLYLMTYDLPADDKSSSSPANRVAVATTAMIRMASITPATAAIVDKKVWTIDELGFKDLGPVTVAALSTQMPQKECATVRGGLMEQALRIRYAQEMNRRRGPERPLKLPPKPVSSPAPDIDHEYAEFLAELAAEMLEH